MSVTMYLLLSGILGLLHRGHVQGLLCSKFGQCRGELRNDVGRPKTGCETLQRVSVPHLLHCFAPVPATYAHRILVYRGSSAHMAVHPAVFVPPIVVAHVLGFILLGYSLEKVFGVFSKLLRRIRPGFARRSALQHSLRSVPQPKLPSEADEAPTEAQPSCSDTDWDSSVEARARAGLIEAPQFRVLSQPWVRGCDCEVCLTATLDTCCHA